MHEDHRKVSQLSDEDHVTLTMQRKEQMEKINILAEKSNRSDEEEGELASLRDRFNHVLSADFQTSKLLPNWGLAPQSGSTYYSVVHLVQIYKSTQII